MKVQDASISENYLSRATEKRIGFIFIAVLFGYFRAVWSRIVSFYFSNTDGLQRGGILEIR